MMRNGALCLALAAATLAAPAIAQDTGAAPAEAKQDTPSAKDDIVVNGVRRKATETFVRALTATRDGHQVARWNGQICLKVVGLWPEREAMIASRVAEVAKLVGVAYQTAPKCEVNTTIAFTGQADKFTAEMIRSVPTLITDVEYFGRPSKKTVAPYLAPRPVRWFAMNETTLSDGMHAGAVGYGGGGMAVDASPSSIPASRLTARTRENTVASLIVVDEAKLSGIKWAQLADYLAMVTLAQPAIDADFSGYDSIMAMFAARDAKRPGAPGLTLADRAFLTGLYKTAANLSPAQQRGVIADAVRKTSRQKP